MKDNVLSSPQRRAFYFLGLFFFSLLFVLPIKAINEPLLERGTTSPERNPFESKEFSLIVTGGLPDYVYTIYGHVALRLQDKEEGIDEVYNWGIFDFDAPNFIGKFIKGNTTDYMLGVQDTELFITQYLSEGSKVYETELNLSPVEKERICKLLEDNLQDPYYLYNFVFDNCSTRPFELLKQAVEGQLVYPDVLLTTRRKMVDQFAKGRPWLEFGTDVVLGKPADKEIGAEDQLFLPLYANELVKGIKIVSSNGQERNLAGEQTVYPSYVEQKSLPKFSFFLLPFFVTLAIFIITEFTCYYPKRNCLWFRIWSTLFLAAMGLAGCLVFYLSFFSLHPLVYPNFNIMVYHPLYLLVSIPTLWIRKNLFGHLYHLLNILVQILFILLVAWISSQVFSPCTLFLSMASMSISLRYSGAFILTNIKKIRERGNCTPQ